MSIRRDADTDSSLVVDDTTRRLRWTSERLPPTDDEVTRRVQRLTARPVARAGRPAVVGVDVKSCHLNGENSVRGRG